MHHNSQCTISVHHIFQCTITFSAPLLPMHHYYQYIVTFHAPFKCTIKFSCTITFSAPLLSRHCVHHDYQCTITISALLLSMHNYLQCMVIFLVHKVGSVNFYNKSDQTMIFPPWSQGKHLYKEEQCLRAKTLQNHFKLMNGKKN